MIVAVVNLKGGVSKTTTAVALATAATRAGKRAKVLDADQQSSASLWAMAASETGAPLPFEVASANLATVRAEAKTLAGDPGAWAFIDCPPNGKIVDEAVSASDYVIVPTTTGASDMAKTMEVASTLEAQGRFYAVLVTRALPRTVALRQTLEELERAGASYFEVVIWQREALKGLFGSAFGEELFGYEEVFHEMERWL